VLGTSVAGRAFARSMSIVENSLTLPITLIIIISGSATETSVAGDMNFTFQAGLTTVRGANQAGIFNRSVDVRRL